MILSSPNVLKFMVLTFPTIIAVVDNTPHNITYETTEEYTILSNIWFNFVIQDL